MAARVTSSWKHTAITHRSLIPSIRPIARHVAVHGTVKELENIETFEEFVAQEGVVVIDFYTTWCGPCKLIAPKVEEMANQITAAKFGKLDLTSMPGAGPFTKEKEVKSLPTFHIYKNGVKLQQMTGNNPSGLRSMIMAAVEP